MKKTVGGEKLNKNFKTYHKVIVIKQYGTDVRTRLRSQAH